MDEEQVNEDAVPANSVGGGGVAMFSPVLQVKSRKRRMSDMLRRWLQGR